jgi:hypothetical protein
MPEGHLSGGVPVGMPGRGVGILKKDCNSQLHAKARQAKA